MSHPLAHPLAVARTALRWLLLAAAVGVLAGGSCAVFLSALDWATEWREQHPWIIALLPLAGLVIGLSYHWFGGSVEAGSELVLAEIHQPRHRLPLRMAPMILISTVATHLFGGSAGREGTALQMGASLADQLSRPLRLDQRARRILLMAGVSSGFGAVFGTPIAGAIFALEVLALGAMRRDALLPCLIAAVIGDRVAIAFGVRHTEYVPGAVPALTLLGILAAVGAGAVFGLAALAFAALTRAIRAFAQRTIAWMPGRLVVGGILVALAVLALGTTRHIGLGIPTIVESFAHASPPSDALLK
ncbi:MAG: chloride channel protein, partial [Planctomycetes bacterium]|nr:chloride channel protein [Planctomycetota bacterium]